MIEETRGSIDGQTGFFAFQEVAVGGDHSTGVEMQFHRFSE